ncbi:MAG: ABC transporter permease [Prevotella sp.]|nr:ABC transporter permease [Prevotella sp.]MBR1485150.1 ABC transporter permease [Prevotella sp.]
MNLPLYIARRIYGQKDASREVSRPAIRIAMLGVAIGLAVMIVTVSVVLGFKHTIRDKVVGFGSHIQVQNVLSAGGNVTFPVVVDDSLLGVFHDIPGISYVERYAMAQGILKTDEDFLGVVFKGVGKEYSTAFLESNLVEGSLPQFCDTATTYPLVISRTMANKLQVHAGDRIFAYFIGEDDVRTRRFNVSAVYETNMKRFDDMICLTDIYAVRKLNGWGENECSGAELLIDDFDELESVSDLVIDRVNRTEDHDGNTFTSMNIRELYPQVFSWLELLDINVWIILALMVCVAGFTMISGLLIIILERTQMIGVLKALGARNKTIRRTFLWFSVFIIGRGLLWGNVLGIGIVLLQQFTGIITLDAQTYYVSQAPMELNLPLVALLNVATLVVSVFVLVVPSYLVSYIRPSQSMRYE